MTQWTLSLNKKPIKRFTIKEGWNLTIGRGADADVIVDNTAISRKHASLELKDGQYILSDLGSLNGTFVNGKKINGAEPINQDDTIKLGKFRLAVADESAQVEVSSYGAHPDTEDKTIIVNTKQLSAESAKLSLQGKSSVKVGKARSCDIILRGMFVAAAQFYIVEQNSTHKIVPQRSWVKTCVNGKKIRSERLLTNGDIIKVGSTKIRFYS
jgi:pSer/pThr/pTyr-binding forkhead associated (FHA) protein